MDDDMVRGFMSRRPQEKTHGFCVLCKGLQPVGRRFRSRHELSHL